MANSNQSGCVDNIQDIGPENFFLSSLENGKFFIQRCERTGNAVFYPRAISPFGGGPLRWELALGKGRVYSVTVVRRSPARGGDYNVVLIDLAEGPRLMSTVLDVEADQVRIGMEVCAAIRRQPNGEPRLVFTLVKQATAGKETGNY